MARKIPARPASRSCAATAWSRATPAPTTYARSTTSNSRTARASCGSPAPTSNASRGSNSIWPAGSPRSLRALRPAPPESLTVTGPPLFSGGALALLGEEQVAPHMVERPHRRLARRRAEPSAGLVADLAVDRQHAVDDAPAERGQPQGPDAPVGRMQATLDEPLL